jgi:hypothetical protein
VHLHYAQLELNEADLRNLQQGIFSGWHRTPIYAVHPDSNQNMVLDMDTSGAIVTTDMDINNREELERFVMREFIDRSNDAALQRALRARMPDETFPWSPVEEQVDGHNAPGQPDPRRMPERDTRTTP